MFLLILLGSTLAKLFIPLPEDQIEKQGSGLVGSKPQAEIEEGADPFLVDVQESSKLAEGDDKNTEKLASKEDDKNNEKPASKESEPSSDSSKTGEKMENDTSNNASKKNKSELDTLLETNILEKQKALEPSKLKAELSSSKKDENPENAFWTEVSVNGENRSVLVKIKQVTIVEKMGEKSPTPSITSAMSSVAEGASTKSASGPFPFLKIQLPALSKIFQNIGGSSTPVSSTASASEKPGLFSSILHSSIIASTIGKTASVSSKTTVAKTEGPSSIVVSTSSKTTHISTSSIDISASKGISISVKGKDVVISTKEKEKASSSVSVISSRSISTESISSESAKKKEKSSTSTYINEKVITRSLSIMSSVSSVTTSKKEQTQSASKSQSTSSVSISASTNTKIEHTSGTTTQKTTAFSSIASSTQSASSTKDEPSSLGNVFDILKNMPGSSKYSTSSTFIEGKFSFPKDPKLEKKVFKLSGYISG